MSQNIDPYKLDKLKKLPFMEKWTLAYQWVKTGHLSKAEFMVFVKHEVDFQVEENNC